MLHLVVVLKYNDSEHLNKNFWRKKFIDVMFFLIS